MRPAFFPHPGPLAAPRGAMAGGLRLDHDPELSTRELTAAIVRGDRGAFDRLYRAWFERMLGLAAAATRRDEAFCLDVVQDAFVRVIRSPRVCPTAAELSGWLRRCVLSAAVDRVRAEARRAAREAGRGGAGVGGEDGVSRAEELRWLRDRIAELAPEDRDLLRLRFEVERTLGEIAGSRGGTWGSAHGRLRRTLERLRRAAAEYFA